MAWRELHVFTVGASPVFNAVSRLEESDSPLVERYPLLRRLRGLSPNSEEQEVVGSWAAAGGEVFEGLYSVLELDPRGVSAELNAYFGFRREVLWGESARILLFHTDTGVGRLAAMLVYEFLARRGEVMGVPHRVEAPRVIRGFGGPGGWDEALADTVAKVGAAVLEGRQLGYRVFLNATGGFKPEVSFALAVALLGGVDEAYYIHEASRRVVFLPRLPVGLDREFAEALAAVDGLYVGELRDSIAGSVLRARGYMPEDLERMGLAEVRDGRIVLRGWVRELLKLI